MDLCACERGAWARVDLVVSSPWAYVQLIRIFHGLVLTIHLWRWFPLLSKKIFFVQMSFDLSGLFFRASSRCDSVCLMRRRTQTQRSCLIHVAWSVGGLPTRGMARGGCTTSRWFSEVVHDWEQTVFWRAYFGTWWVDNGSYIIFIIYIMYIIYIIYT